MTNVPRSGWFRFRPRTIFAVAMLATYVGSYYHLSRQGMREAEPLGLAGFLYVPFDEAAATRELTRHRRLAILYAPIQWIDRQTFATDDPLRGVIWGLAE